MSDPIISGKTANEPIIITPILDNEYNGANILQSSSTQNEHKHESASGTHHPEIVITNFVDEGKIELPQEDAPLSSTFEDFSGESDYEDAQTATQGAATHQKRKRGGRAPQGQSKKGKIEDFDKQIEQAAEWSSMAGLGRNFSAWQKYKQRLKIESHEEFAGYVLEMLDFLSAAKTLPPHNKTTGNTFDQVKNFPGQATDQWISIKLKVRTKAVIDSYIVVQNGHAAVTEIAPVPGMPGFQNMSVSSSMDHRYDAKGRPFTRIKLFWQDSSVAQPAKSPRVVSITVQPASDKTRGAKPRPRALVKAPSLLHQRKQAQPANMSKCIKTRPITVIQPRSSGGITNPILSPAPHFIASPVVSSPSTPFPMAMYRLIPPAQQIVTTAPFKTDPADTESESHVESPVKKSPTTISIDLSHVKLKKIPRVKLVDVVKSPNKRGNKTAENTGTDDAEAELIEETGPATLVVTDKGVSITSTTEETAEAHNKSHDTPSTISADVASMAHINMVAENETESASGTLSALAPLSEGFDDDISQDSDEWMRHLTAPVSDESKVNRSVNTQRKVMTESARFIDWCSAAPRNENRPLEMIPPGVLSKLLSEFVKTLTKRDGTDFEADSLSTLYRALHAYLEDRHYPYDILKDKEFMETVWILKRRCKELRAKSAGYRLNASDVLSNDQEETLWQKGMLGTSNPEALQRALWFLFAQNWCSKGVRISRALKWGDVIYEDGGAHLIITDNVERHQIPRNIDNPARCAVELYLEFLKRRPWEMRTPESPFFLVPRSFVNYTEEDIWYQAKPMGLNKINNFMRDMAREANLTGRLTNSSVIRASKDQGPLNSKRPLSGTQHEWKEAHENMDDDLLSYLANPSELQDTAGPSVQVKAEPEEAGSRKKRQNKDYKVRVEAPEPDSHIEEDEIHSILYNNDDSLGGSNHAAPCSDDNDDVHEQDDKDVVVFEQSATSSRPRRAVKRKSFRRCDLYSSDDDDDDDFVTDDVMIPTASNKETAAKLEADESKSETESDQDVKKTKKVKNPIKKKKSIPKIAAKKPGKKPPGRKKPKPKVQPVTVKKEDNDYESESEGSSEEEAEMNEGEEMESDSSEKILQDLIKCRRRTTFNRVVSSYAANRDPLVRRYTYCKGPAAWTCYLCGFKGGTYRILTHLRYMHDDNLEFLEKHMETICEAEKQMAFIEENDPKEQYFASSHTICLLCGDKLLVADAKSHVQTVHKSSASEGLLENFTPPNVIYAALKDNWMDFDCLAGVYYCNICDEEPKKYYVTFEGVKQHLKTHRSHHKQEICDKCYADLDTGPAEDKHSCSFCEFVSYCKCSLDRHVRVRHPLKWCCSVDDCKFYGLSEGAVCRHLVQTHLKLGPFKREITEKIKVNLACKLCSEMVRGPCAGVSKTTRLIDNLHRHFEANHQDYIATLPQDEITTCKKCLKVFLTRESGHHHKLFCAGPRECPLETCHKVFRTFTMLRAHYVNQHAKIKQRILCGQCGANTKPGTKHACPGLDKFKAFMCDTCGRSFLRVDQLKIHVRTHTGEKPYVCDYCDFRGAQRNNILSHIRVHHKDKIHKTS